MSVCTFFGGKPWSIRYEAKKWRGACSLPRAQIGLPPSSALPVGSGHSGHHLHRTKPRRQVLDSISTSPRSLGKTRSRSPFGQASRHSLNVLTTSGAIRNRALAGMRLRPADGVESGGALPDVEKASTKVNIGPAQTAQLGGAQAGEDGGHQQGPPAPFGVVENLVLRRHVNTDLQPALVSLSDFDLIPVAAFWATWPRRCASPKIAFSDVSTFFASERPASKPE